MGFFNSTNRDAKKREKQQNIAKWNEHIRKCARKNRIAQIQHLDDYMRFSSFNHNIIMAKMICSEHENGEHLVRKTQIVFYEEDGTSFVPSFPIEQDEVKRVFFKIIPFFIKCDDDNSEWWLQREQWNHGSSYDCDDSYEGRVYVMDYLFGAKQDKHDSSIKTEDDVFVQKDEVKHLSKYALLFLALIIVNWRDSNFADIIGDYNLWKKKREFLLGYEDIVFSELERRGLSGTDTPEDDFNSENSNEQFTNYGKAGEKDVEYALKWLPKEYKIIERSDTEGIRLLNPSVSDESQEIDHIVVGSNGVFLIETKHLKGNISIDHNGNWTRLVKGETKGIRNPIQQIDRHHIIVKSILEGMVSDKDIHDIICLSYTDSTIDGIENSSVPVVRSDMIERFIVNCESQEQYREADIENILKEIDKYRI